MSVRLICNVYPIISELKREDHVTGEEKTRGYRDVVLPRNVENSIDRAATHLDPF